MDGEVSGGGCGEVMKKHLTIGKADKQGDLGLFGEVSGYFPTKSFSIENVLLIEVGCTDIANASRACRRCFMSLSQMLPELVADASLACWKWLLIGSKIFLEPVRDYLRQAQKPSLIGSETISDRLRNHL